MKLYVSVCMCAKEHSTWQALSHEKLLLLLAGTSASLYLPSPISEHYSQKGHVRTQQEDTHLQSRKRAFSRNQPCQHLDLALPASRTVRNGFLWLKHSSRWYHVLAALADWASQDQALGTCFIFRTTWRVSIPYINKRKRWSSERVK